MPFVLALRTYYITWLGKLACNLYPPVGYLLVKHTLGSYQNAKVRLETKVKEKLTQNQRLRVNLCHECLKNCICI